MDVVYLERVVFFFDFRVLVASVQPNLRDYKCRPYGAWFVGVTVFYRDAAETPKQINPTELKRALKSQGCRGVSGSVGNADRIWVSTPQNRTYRPGWRRLFFLKLTPMVR